MNVKQLLTVGFFLLAFSSGALAQPRGTALVPPPGSPFLGGIPDPSPTNEPLTISIADAVHRALDHNLGAIEAEGGLEHARGTRLISLSDMLPRVDGTLSEARRKINLEAFG